MNIHKHDNSPISLSSFNFPELLKIPDYQQIKKNFFQELVNAQNGHKSSLSFIKHSISEKSLINQGIIQGIVIGGTNYIFSTAKIQKDGKKIVLKQRSGILPILANDKIFFDFLSSNFEEKAEAIGFNFGFPLTPTRGTYGELDGVLLYGDKEHAMKGLVGRTIGKEINILFKKKFGRSIPVAVANDTVCLALSGKGDEDGSLVAGTGFNIGIMLSIDGMETIINIEAGNFNKFEQSDVLRYIDIQSEKPGLQVFEKAVSGKYLAVYFNKKASDLDLSISPITTSQELSKLSSTDGNTVVQILARSLLERSALLIAASIAGVYEFNNRPKKMKIVGEGSILWTGWNYLNNLNNGLIALGVPKNAIEFEHIQNSSINGAFKLVTK